MPERFGVDLVKKEIFVCLYDYYTKSLSLPCKLSYMDNLSYKDSGVLAGKGALILIVEDERELVETLELYLRSHNYQTERAKDGEEALRLFRAAQPDLVLLDVMMPKKDGFEVLRSLRLESKTPIIMLTAKAEEIDKVLGLGLGADDYLVKPYSLRELLARIQAVLRRSQDQQLPESQLIRIGELEVDTYSMSARIKGKTLNLTPTEFKLLHHLAKTPGRAISRSELLEVAIPESDALESAVNVHLKNLRHKLDAQGLAEMLVTVRGLGYRLSL
jgi:two-component system response regulator AdeR